MEGFNPSSESEFFVCSFASEGLRAAQQDEDAAGGEREKGEGWGWLINTTERSFSGFFKTSSWLPFEHFGFGEEGGGVILTTISYYELGCYILSKKNQLMCDDA